MPVGLTDEQIELIQSIVGAYEEGHRSEFLIARTHDGTVLIFGDNHNLSVTADRIDFRRLAIDGFLDLDESGRDPRGKPTAAALSAFATSAGAPTSLPVRTSPTDDFDYDAFICHASEDKTTFVEELAENLRQVGLAVWYDDFALTLGDGLREAIDRGLTKSEFGVVVLSHHFFEKDWPRRELEGLTALERNGRKVILPIWHQIDVEEVRRSSPTLAGMVAVKSSRGIPSVVVELLKAMNKIRGLRSQRPRLLPVSVAQQVTIESDPVQRVKALLGRPPPRIDLNDFVLAEVRALCKTLSSDQFDVKSAPVAKEPFLQRLEQYERASTPAMKMLATIGYHGTPAERELVTDVVWSLGEQRSHEGAAGWTQLQYYPALLIEYATGVAAVARHNFQLLAAALIDPLLSLGSRSDKVPAVRALNYPTVFMSTQALYEWLPTNGRRRSSASDYLIRVVRPILAELLPGESQLDDAYDTFEFIVGASAMFVDSTDWAPFGRFIWRHRRDFQESPPVRFFKQGFQEGDDWGLIKAGFFDRSSAKSMQAFEGYCKLLSKVPAFHD
jgi:hypothetical protein